MSKKIHIRKISILLFFILFLEFFPKTKTYASILSVNEDFRDNQIHYYWSPTVGPKGMWYFLQEELYGEVVLDTINTANPSTYHLLTGLNDNYIIEVDVKNILGVDKCIRFNDNRTNSYYKVNLRSEFHVGDGLPQGNDINLQKYVDGAFPLLIQKKFSNSINDWYTIKIEIISKKINVYVENNLLIEYEDENFLLGTNIALEVWPGGHTPDDGGSVLHNKTVVAFDNIKVYKQNSFPLILVPGITACYNSALLTNEIRGEWTLPPISKKIAYSNFLASLNESGYVEGKDWYIFCYDWRRPLVENVEALHQFIEGKNFPDQVNLVGHSMGGLISRLYLQDHFDNVNKVAILGSPHEGSTDTYPIWEGGVLWGDSFTRELTFSPFVLKHPYNLGKRLESIRAYAPSIKDLFPTYDFLFYENNSGQNIFRKVETQTFKNDVLPEYNLSLDQTHLNKILNVYSDYENTLKHIQIISPYPIANWVQQNQGLWVDGEPVFNTDTCSSPLCVLAGLKKDYASSKKFGNGDKTVLVSSGHDLLASAYDELEVSVDHAAIPQTQSVINKIFSFFGMSGGFTEDEDGILETITRGLTVILRSPATMKLIDQSGNEIGHLADLSKPIENGFYDEVGKFILIPNHSEGDYSLVITGEENGQFGLLIGLYDGQKYTYVEYQLTAAKDNSRNISFSVNGNELNVESPDFGLERESLANILSNLAVENTCCSPQTALMFFLKADEAFTQHNYRNALIHLRNSLRHFNLTAAHTAKKNLVPESYVYYDQAIHHYQPILTYLINETDFFLGGLGKKSFSIYEKQIEKISGKRQNNATAHLFESMAQSFLDSVELYNTDPAAAYARLYTVKTLLPYLH